MIDISSGYLEGRGVDAATSGLRNDPAPVHVIYRDFFQRQVVGCRRLSPCIIQDMFCVSA